MVERSDAVSFNLAGRTAVVTGAGKNIGKAIAIELARAGANVVVNGLRDKAAVDDTVEQIAQLGKNATPFMADVSDAAQIDAMIAHATKTFGTVDIVVNNAAVRPFQPLLSISLDDWDCILRSNLTAAFYIAKLVIPGMVERNWGRVIQISGMDGFTGERNRVHNVVCKAGMHAMAKCIGQEFGAHGITANTIAPGWVDTERDWSKYPHVNMENEKLKIPARRIGTVGDIAGACVYLASDASAYVNGQVLHVNGGWHMY